MSSWYGHSNSMSNVNICICSTELTIDMDNYHTRGDQWPIGWELCWSHFGHDNDTVSCHVMSCTGWINTLWVCKLWSHSTAWKVPQIAKCSMNLHMVKSMLAYQCHLYCDSVFLNSKTNYIIGKVTWLQNHLQLVHWSIECATTLAMFWKV